MVHFPPKKRPFTEYFTDRLCANPPDAIALTSGYAYSPSGGRGEDVFCAWLLFLSLTFVQFRSIFCPCFGRVFRPVAPGAVWSDALCPANAIWVIVAQQAEGHAASGITRQLSGFQPCNKPALAFPGLLLQSLSNCPQQGPRTARLIPWMVRCCCA